MAAADAVDIGPAKRLHLVTSGHAISTARYAFDRREKVSALRAARGALARFAADILLDARGEWDGPEVALVGLLEADLLRRLGGRLKWAESLGTAS